MLLTYHLYPCIDAVLFISKNKTFKIILFLQLIDTVLILIKFENTRKTITFYRKKQLNLFLVINKKYFELLQKTRTIKDRQQ